MIIKRTIVKDNLNIKMNIELTAMEVRNAYYEHQRIHRTEAISNRLDAMDESDMCGYKAQEVIEDSKIMALLLESFFKHEDCEQAENDVMDACIRNVLAEHAQPKKGRLTSV